MGSSTQIMPAEIAILGAGPSGLTLGRLLENANIPYVIYERDESASWASGRGGSGTLDLHQNSGQQALQSAGLLDEFMTLARGEGHNLLVDAEGKVLADFGEAGETGRPEIDRKDLRGLLLRSVPEERIQWGRKVSEVRRKEGKGVEIEFADGSVEAGFRLVVGADGAWSKARSLLTSEMPIYSGFHFITGYISPSNPHYSHAEKLAGVGNYMVFSKGKAVGAMRLGDGSYHLMVGLRLPETWSEENESLLKDGSAFRKYLLEVHFTDYASVNTDLVKNSDGEFHDWPLYAMNPDTLAWKSVPGVTLIGDAAHVTTPFEGEGVNCAMHDSYELAKKIIEHGLGDIDAAVAEYEKEMFPRGEDLIRRSAKNGELLFAHDSPRAFMESIGLNISKAD